MARPRKKDRHLPPCVHFRHSAYYLVRGGKWIRLASDLGTALAKYAAQWKLSSGSFGGLVDTALAAHKAKLSSGSWKQYQSAARKLKHIFAEFLPEQIRPLHVKRLKRDMIGQPIPFNACLTVLRLVLEYAVDEELIELNPCIGTKPYTVAPRDRLVTPEEFRAIYAKCDWQLQCLMDLLYLTGQRVNDALAVRYADLRDDGIYFQQGKTGVRLLVRWTPELRAVVERIKAMPRHLKAITLLHSRRGKRLDYDTASAAWRTACADSGAPYTQLRDFRAMSGTATKKQGKNAQKLLGHKTAQTTDTYLRDRDPEVVDGPSFGQSKPGY